MKKPFSKALLTLILMVMSLVSLAEPSAAKTAWTPRFQAGQHVYVDPSLAGDPTYPLSVPTEADLQKVDHKHGIVVFVVAVEQGVDAQGTGGLNWAAGKLNQLAQQWCARPDFPADDYLLIMWVRSRDNPPAGWMVANSGSKLRGYGLTKAMFSDPVGPVMSAVKLYMPNNPRGCFLAIAGNVNQVIDNAGQSAKQAQEHKDAFSRALGSMVLVALMGLIGCMLLGMFKHYQRAQQEAMAMIATWQHLLDSANELYVKLNDGYLGFLKQQSDWASRFKGTTLARYKAAVTDFADFTVRIQAANQVLVQAKATAQRSIFPTTGGFKRAVSLLSDQEVTVDGKELPLEQATLFGGLIEKSTYKPGQLLSAASDLFNRTNQALSGIKQSVEAASKNKEEIDELLSDVDETRTSLTYRGHSLEQFHSRYNQIREGESQVVEIIASDPCSAQEASVSLISQARALKSDLEWAVKNS